MSAMMQGQAQIPFTAAALRYREKIWTKQFTPAAAAQDISPPRWSD